MPATCSSLPDPAPITTDRWLKVQVHLDRGKLGITSYSPEQTRRAQSTKRSMGRFAAELWIGCELIERLRFEFPLLAAEPSTGKAQEPSFERAGRFEVTILIPESDRATRLELVDRAHATRQRFDWPLRADPKDASEPQTVHP